MRCAPLYALAGMLLLATQSPAFEVQAVLKESKAAERLLVLTVGQETRTIRAPEGVKVFDEAGHELPDGLKAKELREGVRLTLTVERENDKPVLRSIRLGGKAAAAKPAAKPRSPGPKVQQDTSALVPLTDLGTGEYEGFPGGLYPEGKNTRPADHTAKGVELAQKLQPLDAEGKPSAEGRIVLLGIGFSNTVQAFNGFMEVAKADPDVNPKLVLVNGAVGGMSASMVQDPDDQKSGTKYWSTVDERLKAAGVTRAQVQAVWIKETNPTQQQEGGFPKCIQDLEQQITKIVQVLPKRFANVKLAYLSSRTYGGWALPRPDGRGPGNSEPFSYESGFAVKWLVGRQLQGDPGLNFDPAKGPVKAPWLSWAAYLWTNGAKPRGDGLFFEYDDFTEQDRMHESSAGQRKVGNLLLKFFKTDPTTRSWFVRPGGLEK
jgi:hypothetical protein